MVQVEIHAEDVQHQEMEPNEFFSWEPQAVESLEAVEPHEKFQHEKAQIPNLLGVGHIVPLPSLLQPLQHGHLVLCADKIVELNLPGSHVLMYF